MESEKTIDFENLKQEISKSAKEHNVYGSWDGVVYNSTMIAAIILTSLAALASIDILYIKMMSAAASILITIDRAINWGSRWIYHRQMRHEYLIILAKISFYENMPANFTEDEKKANYIEIYTEIYKTRRKEISMPGLKTE